MKTEISIEDYNAADLYFQSDLYSGKKKARLLLDMKPYLDKTVFLFACGIKLWSSVVNQRIFVRFEMRS